MEPTAFLVKGKYQIALTTTGLLTASVTLQILMQIYNIDPIIERITAVPDEVIHTEDGELRDNV